MIRLALFALKFTPQSYRWLIQPSLEAVDVNSVYTRPVGTNG